MKKSTILKLTDLKKEYKQKNRGAVYALGGVDLEIERGETFGLVGESGCGKSTLAHHIVRLLKPTDGNITYYDNDKTYDYSKLNREDEKELKKKIQIIFQDPYSSINPKKTISYLMEEPLIIYNIGKDKTERKQIVRDAICSVGLDVEYLNYYPSMLSGGQRQRIAIALALILKPEFVLCDEAVSALDVSVQAQVLNLLNELKEKYNLTYLFISHNLDVVSYMSDRIGVMYLGNIVELGDATKISTNPMHPYTKALFSSSLSIDNKLDKIVLEGELPSSSNIPSGCVFHTRCPYTTEKCRNEKPNLIKHIDGRCVACHYAGEMI